MTVDHVE